MAQRGEGFEGRFFHECGRGRGRRDGEEGRAAAEDHGERGHGDGGDGEHCGRNGLERALAAHGGNELGARCFARGDGGGDGVGAREGGGDSHGGGRAIGGIGLGAAFDERGECGVYASGADGAEARGGGAALSHGLELGVAFGFPGWGSGEQLEDDEAQGVDVGPLGDALS